MRKSAGIALPKGKLGSAHRRNGSRGHDLHGWCGPGAPQEVLPVGSLTQLGTIRLGKRTEGRAPAIKEFVPLEKLENIVFGGWDIFPDSAYEAAKNAAVLSSEHLAEVKKFLSKIRPMKAAFDQNYVKKLTGTHVKKGAHQVRPGAADPRRHSEVSKEEQGFPHRRDLVRLDGNFPQAARRVRHARKIRGRDEGKSSGDRAFDAVRLGRDYQRSAVCQWRAQFDRRYSGAHRTGAGSTAFRSAARISRPGRH